MRAGADEVVSPYGLTGCRMAVLAVQLSVLEVLDLLNLGSDIRLEEVAVQAGTHLDSLTIAEARARYAGVGFKMLDGRRWPACWRTTRRSRTGPRSLWCTCPTSMPPIGCPRRPGLSPAPAGRHAGCCCT